MLSAVAKLMIAALISVHQYIPNENQEYTKYYNHVSGITEENMLPAAHQSCRYLISVFVGAGLDTTLGGDNQNSLLSKTFVNIFAGDQTIEWAMGLLEQPKYQEKLKNHGVNSDEVKKIIRTFCQKEFKPFVFSAGQRKEIFDFLNTEINVLTESQIKSLGDYKYFGSADLLDRSSQQIGTIDAIPRAWVPYKKLSKNLILALIATEDEDFLTHRGVDTKAIARIVKQVLSESRATGGSTVTMQVLKNMFFNKGPDSQYQELNTGEMGILLRKVREWYWAWPFEKSNTRVLGDLSAKEYVLELYFNLVEFGPRIQGIEQASQVYFKKSADQLTIAESAFIVTLLKAPSTYSNPKNYVERTIPRRNDYVIERMKTLGLINQTQYEEAINTSLPNWESPTTIQVDGPSLYVRENAREWLKSYNFPDLPQAKDIVVETTIDKDLQNVVYNVVKENLDKHDETRDVLKNVGPSRDDRGRTGRFREEDFGKDMDTALTKLKTTLDKSDSEFMVVVYLGKSGKEKLFYYKSEELLNPDKKLNKKINSLLNSKSYDIGQPILIRYKDKSLDIVTSINIDDFRTTTDQSLVEGYVSDVEKIMSSSKDWPKTFVRNTLNRLEWAKPRPGMVPAIYLLSYGLIDKNFNKVNLTDSHRSFFDKKTKSGEFADGEVFWLKDSNPIPEPTAEELEAQALAKEGIDPKAKDPIVKQVKDSKDIVYVLDAPKLQAAVVVMNSNTGEVLATFGGYDPSISNFDRSRFAKRQAGSTLKPWVYFYAMNKGFNPQDVLNNRSVTFQIDKNKYYSPKNYSGGVGGELALYKALAQSQNIAALSLLQHPKWGPDWHTNLDELRGFFKSVQIYENPINSPTIVLGAQELPIETLVSSFTYFSNGKHIVKPQYFQHLSDRRGNVYFDGKVETIDVNPIKPSSIYQIQSLMLETANTGTAASLRSFVSNLNNKKYKESCFNNLLGLNKQSCFGGKTGTSDQSKDTWFMGISKNFVIGIWVGYDYPRPLGGDSTGGSVSLPIFKGIIEQGERYLPPIEPIIDPADMPSDLERRTVYGNTGCGSGQAKNEYIIYSDYGSSQSNCSTFKPQAQANCQCRRVLYAENDYDYYLDVIYQGKKYIKFKSFETQGTENDKNDCLAMLAKVENEEGQRICVQ